MTNLRKLLLLAVIAITAALTGCSSQDTNGCTDTDSDWAAIIINGESLPGSYFITVGDDIFPTHIPLIMVAEALGSIVNWNTNTGAVSLDGLNGTISFTVGERMYNVGRETIDWMAPSVVIDGNLYVPIPFFRAAFGMGNAMWISGHIYIDTEACDMQ